MDPGVRLNGKHIGEVKTCKEDEARSKTNHTYLIISSRICLLVRALSSENTERSYSAIVQFLFFFSFLFIAGLAVAALNSPLGE